VAAARALIGRPELIVADEPTSALDKDARGDFIDLMLSEAKSAGSSIIMVSHDEDLSRHFDRVVRLSDIARTSQGGRS
jgi:putative ABC transport system ATP-binding protein